jgi:hypothetical protein
MCLTTHTTRRDAEPHMTQMTGPMAEALARNREALNARFASAQMGGSRIDQGAFMEHLADVVEPIVRAVAAEFAEKVDSVTLALYDLSLELFGATLLGSESTCPQIALVWRKLLPRLPRLLAREPGRVAGSLSNAVHNLALTPGARPEEWLDRMIALTPFATDVRNFLDSGKILAWRAGMTQYREGALATARQLDLPVAARALGLPEAAPAADIATALDRITENPWMSPTDALANAADPRRMRIVARIGAFRGFGGPFLRPPTVIYQHDSFLVSDGDSTWMLLADLHGSTFQRIDNPPLKPNWVAAAIQSEPDGTLRWGDAVATFEELAGFSSHASDGKTLAITLPTSHHVFLLARG